MAKESILLEKALKSAGGLDEFKRKRDQFYHDLAYFDKKQEELIEKYNENWIAIYKSEVVAHRKGYNDILTQIEKMGLPEEQLVIKFISSRDVIALYTGQWER